MRRAKQRKEAAARLTGETGPARWQTRGTRPLYRRAQGEQNGAIGRALAYGTPRQRRCDGARTHAAAKQGGQLRREAGADGTARAGALSSRGCPSNVAATFCSGGHVATGARQVALAQGAYKA
jgi:hypothetical protein